MLVRDFLKNIAPGMLVKEFDLDKELGKNKIEDEAGALAIAHHFDYNTEVIDFFIYHDNITIWIKRK